MIGQNMYGRIAAVAAALVLAACGGGGGGDSGATEAAKPVVKPSCYLNAQNGACVVDGAAVNRSVTVAGDQAKLRALFAKMKAGGHYVIAFKGGSITYGTGASEITKAWPTLTFNWFTATFPKSSFEYVNNSVPGNDSGLDLIGWPEFLAAKRPDIVILDAAVNDWLFSVAGIERNPGPSYGQLLDDIQTVGAVAVSLETMLPKYKQYQGCLTGQDMHTTQQISHNVMVVSEKDGLCTVTTDGTLAQSDWSFDGVHPNDFGYQMLASLLTKNFEKVMATSQ